MKHNQLKNIFNLIQITDKKEPAISISFANILVNDRKILQKFLKNLGIVFHPKDFKSIVTATEPFYKNLGRRNRIDIEIKSNEKFLIFIELKILDNKFSEFQIGKYLKILKQKKPFYSKVVLCLVTQLNEEKRFKNVIKRININKVECKYFRLDEIAQIVRKYCSESYMLVNKIFLDYLQWMENLGNLLLVKAAIPKGNLKKRIIGGNTYYYLQKREGRKVKHLYLGKLTEKEIDKYRDIDKKRKEIRRKISALKSHIKALR